MIDRYKRERDILYIYNCFDYKKCDIEAISLGRVVAHFPKTFINLSWTYEKLHCKVEPYRFDG